MATRLAPPGPQPEPPESEDPFPYGWRYVQRELSNGEIGIDQVPLTLEDALHPQEEDVIPEVPIHEQERGYLTWTIRGKNLGRPAFLVLSDCLVDWGVPDLRDTSPDVSVFEGLQRDPDLTKGTFRRAQYGARCLLATEIVSPRTRTNDVLHKFDEYARAGVPLYVIVDQEREGGPRWLRGYHLTPTGYDEVSPDTHGRLPLESVRLLIGLRNNRMVLWDADTEEEIRDAAQEHQARLEAQEAERTQSEARQRAEQERQQETEARQRAEQERQQETEARQRAELRVRELEAELERLRGPGGTPAP